MHWHVFLTMYSLSPPMEIILWQDEQRNRSCEVRWLGEVWKLLLAIWEGCIYLWSLNWSVCSVRRKKGWRQQFSLRAFCCLKRKRRRREESSLCVFHWRHARGSGLGGGMRCTLWVMAVTVRFIVKKDKPTASVHHRKGWCKIYCFFLVIYVLVIHCRKYG